MKDDKKRRIGSMDDQDQIKDQGGQKQGGRQQSQSQEEDTLLEE